MPTKAELEEENAQLRSKMAQLEATPSSSDSTTAALHKLMEFQGDQMAKLLERQNQESEARFERLVEHIINPHPSRREIPEAREMVTRPDERLPVVPKAIAKTPPQLEDAIDYRQWKQWLSAWRNYALLIKLGDFPREEQIASFRTFCSPKLQSKMEHSMNIPIITELSLDEIFEKISRYLKERHNLALDRYRLLHRHQEEGELFDDFYTAIQELAADAELRLMGPDDWVAVLILVGIQDDQVRQKLLAQTPHPTLLETITRCRNEEKGRLGVKDLRSPDLVVAGANRQRTPYQKERNEKRASQLSDQSEESNKQRPEKCRDCGFRHFRDRLCPAKSGSAKCHKCGGIGHFAPVCHLHQTGSYLDKSLNAVLIAGIGQSPQVTIKVLQCETGQELGELGFIPDTGAEGTVAGLNALHALNFERSSIAPVQTKIVGITGKSLRPIGEVKVSLQLGKNVVIEKITFCKEVNQAYLSLNACKGLGIIHDEFPMPIQVATTKGENLEYQTESVWDDLIKYNIPTSPTHTDIAEIRGLLLKCYKDVFNQDEKLKPMTGPALRIELKSGAIPYAIHAARPVPYAQRDEAKALVDKLVRNGIWEAVGDRPTEWSHPLVIQTKANGTLRLCGDLKNLNDQVHRPVHPMRTPQEAVSQLPTNAKFFTTLDATSGYWQIPLHPESKDLTTILTPWGRFVHTRGPMGMISTGDAYNLRGDQALGDLPNLAKVVDDICIANEEFPTHVQSVAQVLERCRKHQITLNPDKFQFGEESVKFVGYILSHKGIAADPQKVQAIANFPEPTNRTELRSFMGLVNQLGQFSAKIAGSASPLRELMKTRMEFVWTSNHTEAFREIKQSLVEPPILAQFDPHCETILQTDASRTKGLGYALVQKHGNQNRLIQCGSRFLSGAESNYAMVELEALAIAWAMKKCRVFLLGLPTFRVITDHRPLVTIFNSYTCAQVENPRKLNKVYSALTQQSRADITESIHSNTGLECASRFKEKEKVIFRYPRFWPVLAFKG